MNTEANIRYFEFLVSQIKRPGRDELLNYCRKSDFYRAPASTKFHLSCEGGLLQHSINVFEALRHMGCTNVDDDTMEYNVYGQQVVKTPYESIIVAALFHDLCKTNFYSVEYRNQKVYKSGGSKHDAHGNFDWESVPFYIVEDKNPYGHGEKSVMMVDQFMRLTMEERYAIRWHMGMSEANIIATYNQAAAKYPLVLFLHTADQMASLFMEDKTGNKPEFEFVGQMPEEDAQPAANEPVFQEAVPL